ncbi:hypothetical protein SRHO_G00087980 [Serrasalmus rhombeus]
MNAGEHRKASAAVRHTSSRFVMSPVCRFGTQRSVRCQTSLGDFALFPAPLSLSPSLIGRRTFWSRCEEAEDMTKL